jgi:hypothetical protein
MEQEIWDTLHRHLASIYSGDVKTYEETTGDDLSLFEWWVTGYATRLCLQCTPYCS